jgi:hypothetical protein
LSVLDADVSTVLWEVSAQYCSIILCHVILPAQLVLASSALLCLFLPCYIAIAPSVPEQADIKLFRYVRQHTTTIYCSNDVGHILFLFWMMYQL